MPGEEVGSGYSGKKMKKKHTFREMFGIRDLFQGGKSVSDEEDSLQQKLAHVGAILRRRFLYTNMKEDSNGLGNRVRHSYCMPTFATLPVVTLLGVYLTDFYENMGVTLGYLSFFIALARSLDVISDPLMSSITDSCRSKYGRRRPFCIIGCWFYAAFLMCLLSPPSLPVSGMNSWFGAFYMLFFLANTFTTIPYDALGPELTDNYEDRNKLFFVSGLYDAFGALIAIMLPEGVAYWVSLAYATCDDSTCYSNSGVGVDCLPSVNTGEYDVYDLGFSEGMGPPASWFNDTACATNDDPWYGLENFCSCVGVCSTRCGTDSKRVAFSIVGFFFGAWFCLTMVNLWFNVKERAQDKEDKEADIIRETSGIINQSLLNDSNAPSDDTQSRAIPNDEVLWSIHQGKLPESFEANLTDAPSMIPSLLNTFRNKPFAMVGHYFGNVLQFNRYQEPKIDL